jgi:hypothetical protein
MRSKHLWQPTVQLTAKDVEPGAVVNQDLGNEVRDAEQMEGAGDREGGNHVGEDRESGERDDDNLVTDV